MPALLLTWIKNLWPSPITSYLYNSLLAKVHPANGRYTVCATLSSELPLNGHHPHPSHVTSALTPWTSINKSPLQATNCHTPLSAERHPPNVSTVSSQPFASLCQWTANWHVRHSRWLTPTIGSHCILQKLPTCLFSPNSCPTTNLLWWLTNCHECISIYSPPFCCFTS